MCVCMYMYICIVTQEEGKRLAADAVRLTHGAGHMGLTVTAE